MTHVSERIGERVFLVLLAGADVADTTKLRYGVCVHVPSVELRDGARVVLGEQALVLLR